MSKHPNFDNDMASFDKTMVEFLQKLNFPRNILKFFLGCIPIFDDKITAMKNKVYETPSNPRWEFLTSVQFKTLIKQHQDWLPLRQMVK